jgi:hypothetical protein
MVGIKKNYHRGIYSRFEAVTLLMTDHGMTEQQAEAYLDS